MTGAHALDVFRRAGHHHWDAVDGDDTDTDADIHVLVPCSLASNHESTLADEFAGLRRFGNLSRFDAIDRAMGATSIPCPTPRERQHGCLLEFLFVKRGRLQFVHQAVSRNVGGKVRWAALFKGKPLAGSQTARGGAVKVGVEVHVFAGEVFFDDSVVAFGVLFLLR